ncbi:hypothetical protein [Reyranella sp.]|uniref:hypothetical protein n=1 Tax=Reyranella sp. TaxID=1929291 RepID=UPI003BAB84BE
MTAVGRNLSVVALMAVVVALAAMVLPSAMWVCALAALLGLAGVVLLRGNGWRTGALLAAALALSLALLDAFAGLLTPAAHGSGLVRTMDPRWWPPPDPVVGFRPRPDTQVIATATFDGALIYRRLYHFDATAARVTPAAPAGADTYLFLGDSFTFGQGLEDGESLAAQFADLSGRTLHAVNLGVPGYAPNHLVRLFEGGLLDRYTDKKVKAVVTWIIPAQLARITGEGSWLGTSPRYALEDGKLVWTGTFDGWRLSHPLAGAKYYLGELFPFVEAIGRQQRQEEQAALFVALLERLQKDARAKFDAPLLVLYSWPDKQSRPGHGQSDFKQDLLVEILERLRARGLPMMRVDDFASGYPVDKLLIPHDGHPTAFQNGLIAKGLQQRLLGNK